MPVANRESPLVPNFEIIINSSPLPVEAKLHVQRLTVDHDVNLPGMFTLELTGSDSQEEETIWIDDEELFAIGNVVEVKLGYGNDLETLIIGEITGIEPEFAIDRLPSLTVRGYSRRHRLQRGRKTKTFVQQKDSEIATQIAQDAGLTAQVEDSQVVHDYILQGSQTDIEFLQERAKRINYEVVVEDKTLFFRPVGNAESEILTLSFEDDLMEFYPHLSSMGQVSELTVRGWNPKEKQEIVGEARVGDEVSTMGGQNSGAALVEDAFGTAVATVSDRPVLTQAEADQFAKARFNNLALGLITGEGVCWGRTDLRPGKVIKIDGVGKRFSGQYYVTATVNRYQAQSGYRTHFTVRRNGT
ncbi:MULTISPECIES: phage late control D family protein [Okeania]|uniref:Phage late control D family protein n=1 Tax=Okeania hirsuta TaxID=1458930 RepID=A0A3N6PI51_9CYAN|nr:MULTISPECIES: phage late control D family protein [Okeania]NES88023.1 phage late control D family protein [Okeania sp. SIO2B9]NET77573.1 phage late control D family protein [Okeania sp. SIO1F9]RQH53451.1 phage late control D family protein [Okeania hirsuta]